MLVVQGHFQIMFSKYCPLTQRKLSLFMKIMYCSGVWSYIVGALTAPLYIIIPLLTIWAGMFPIVVSWWAAGGCSVSPTLIQQIEWEHWHLTRGGAQNCL